MLDINRPILVAMFELRQSTQCEMWKRDWSPTICSKKHSDFQPMVSRRPGILMTYRAIPLLQVSCHCFFEGRLLPPPPKHLPRTPVPARHRPSPPWTSAAADFARLTGTVQNVANAALDRIMKTRSTAIVVYRDFGSGFMDRLYHFLSLWVRHSYCGNDYGLSALSLTFH